LFALIRVDQQHDFIVTHGVSLWIPGGGSRREASNPRAARLANAPRIALGRVASGNDTANPPVEKPAILA
jgi:hypothetical protein